MLRYKLGTLFYAAESIFGIAFELVQKLLTSCKLRCVPHCSR